MLTLPSSVRIYVAAEPVDLRRGFDGLAAATRQVIGAEPMSGHVFVFLNRRRNRVKLLIWDRTGYLLLYKMRRAGKSSERIDPEQLALLFEELVEQMGGEPDAPDPEAEAKQDAQLEAEIEAAKAEHKTRRRKPSEPSRRSWRTAESVERRVHTIEVPAEQRTCERCGREKQKIGEDASPLLEYVPGHFVEHEYRREKWACGTCKWGVTTAPAPEKIIKRSAADASLLAHVVVSKFVDHTPLHRLHRIYERTGATIPVSTLSDWVGEVADRVTPLVDRIAARIVEEAYVARTDATGLRVLDPNSPDNIERGTIWALVGDDKDVVFRYTPTGEGTTGPWQFLAGRNGYLQADAASVFGRLYNGRVPSAVEVGCWSHARRKFVALQDTDPPYRLLKIVIGVRHREPKEMTRAALRSIGELAKLDLAVRQVVDVGPQVRWANGQALLRFVLKAFFGWQMLIRFRAAPITKDPPLFIAVGTTRLAGMVDDYLQDVRSTLDADARHEIELLSTTLRRIPYQGLALAFAGSTEIMSKEKQIAEFDGLLLLLGANVSQGPMIIVEGKNMTFGATEARRQLAERLEALGIKEHRRSIVDVDQAGAYARVLLA